MDKLNSSIDDARKLQEEYYKSFPLNYLDLIIDNYQLSSDNRENDEDAFNCSYRELDDHEEQQRGWSDDYESNRELDDEDLFSKYAQKYGLDDKTIDEAFENDPELYWNID